MSTSVLITYATRYGSTKEVAEHIGKQIIENGKSVEIKPCKEMKNLKIYDFVILGTPYYIGKMLKDAKNFLEKNQVSLSHKPVAIFALGPIGEDEKEKTEAKEQMDNELNQFTWLQPVATEMFGGNYNPETLRFFDKLLTKPPASPLHDLAANDSRNWEDITAWTKQLIDNHIIQK